MYLDAQIDWVNSSFISFVYIYIYIYIISSAHSGRLFEHFVAPLFGPGPDGSRNESRLVLCSRCVYGVDQLDCRRSVVLVGCHATGMEGGQFWNAPGRIVFGLCHGTAVGPVVDAFSSFALGVCHGLVWIFEYALVLSGNAGTRKGGHCLPNAIGASGGHDHHGKGCLEYQATRVGIVHSESE